jgi:hypothetical protein
MTEAERIRWAIYAAIGAALASKSSKRYAVARALDALAQSYP